MASVENMPLTGGLLLSRKRMSWPTLHLLARSCVGDQFIADSRIKRAYQGRPLGQAQRALSPPNAASRRRTSYDYLRLPDPRIIKLDRKTGYGISRWSAHQPDLQRHDALHADRHSLYDHHVFLAGHDSVAAQLPLQQLKRGLLNWPTGTYRR